MGIGFDGTEIMAPMHFMMARPIHLSFLSLICYNLDSAIWFWQLQAWLAQSRFSLSDSPL
jgi:hypothetical protein